MSPYADFRKNERFDQNVTVLIQNEQTGCFVYGQMINRSIGGMLIGSDIPISPGIEIDIKMEKVVSKIYNATIKWCNELREHDSGFLYGLGVTYI